jgi:hypothetical protein
MSLSLVIPERAAVGMKLDGPGWSGNGHRHAHYCAFDGATACGALAACSRLTRIRPPALVRKNAVFQFHQDESAGERRLVTLLGRAQPPTSGQTIAHLADEGRPGFGFRRRRSLFGSLRQTAACLGDRPLATRQSGNGLLDGLIGCSEAGTMQFTNRVAVGHDTYRVPNNSRSSKPTRRHGVGAHALCRRRSERRGRRQETPSATWCLGREDGSGRLQD